MNTYRGEGKLIRWYNGTGLAVSSGAVVNLGGVYGIAVTDIASTAYGALMISGVHSLAKLSTDTFTAGQNLYWDSGNSRLTETVIAGALIGVSEKIYGNGTTTATVILNTGAGGEGGETAANVAAMGAQTQDAVTDNTTGTAGTTLAVGPTATQDVVTDNTTGTAGTTLAVGPTATQGILVNSTGGAADLTFDAVTQQAGGAGVELTDGDAAKINNNFTECVTELNRAKADILALNEWAEDLVASLAAQDAKVKADILALNEWVEDLVASLAAQDAKVKVDVAAARTTLNAEIAAIKAAGLQASS